ncbi:MAG: hypothetical protein JOY77_11800 [Alphaproteobacteria bacterium]|nr:hypothetical protein [Alphaproteobacteria bacterium]
MPLDQTLLKLEVSETGKSRDYWATRPWVSGETQAAVRSADIVIVPWEDRGAEQTPSFPTGTAVLVRQFAKLSDVTVAVGIDRDRYAELALHANIKRFPMFFVTAVALPILTTVIANEIQKILDDPSPSVVEMEVIVDPQHGKCISVQYKGPPGDALETLTREIDKCLPRHSEEVQGPQPSAKVPSPKTVPTDEKKAS